jgi:N-acetylmuramoyl-L-alanine amidase
MKSFSKRRMALAAMVLLMGLVWTSGAHGVTVCLDPGHGGTDPGAVGLHYYEKAANLDVSLEARDYLLLVSGVDSVGMTRTTDIPLSLADRCAYANDRGYDRFMCVHHNAYDTNIQGTETYCHTDSLGGPSQNLRDEVHPEIIWAFGYNNRGTKTANFYVLRETNMPSILGEGSFIDYHDGYDESQRFLTNWNDHSGREGYAYCKGFCDHMGLLPPPYSTAYAATYLAKSHPDTMISGDTATAWIEYVNTSDSSWAIWRPDSTRLRTTVPPDRSSDFHTLDDWISPSRPTGVDAITAVGDTGRFTFILTAPAVIDTTPYFEYWGLEQVAKGSFGPPDDSVYFEIVVLPSGEAIVIVVDNEQAAPEFTTIGTWSTGSFPIPYGTYYHWASTGSGNSATWTPNLPSSGLYEVHAWWVAGTNRSSVAPFIINHADGADTLLVNQQQNGNQWNYLDTYPFQAGTSGNVTLTNEAPTGYVVIADAIKFFLMDSTPPKAVQNLVAAKSSSDIHLAWSPVTQDTSGGPESIAHYVVYRSEDARVVPGDSVAGTMDTTYLDAGAAGSTATNYFYVIRATDGSGNKSSNSNQVGEFDVDLIAGP